MKKKIFYAIPIVLLVLGLLVPMLQAHKVTSQPSQSVADKGSAPVTTTTAQATSENKGEQDSSKKQDSADKDQSAAKEGNATEKVAGTASGATSQSPQKVAVAEAVPVNLAVVGQEGELLFKPREVAVKTANHEPVTVLAALRSSGVAYEVSGQWAGFVTAIAGQRNQGQAGWMFKVNDQILMLGADKQTLKSGDRVIWWYSKGLGTHSPTWKELTKQS